VRRVSYENASFQWDDGQRRLQEAPDEDRAALERVTERIVAELRRRLGGAFTTAELADLYQRGTDWCLEVAVSTAPDRPRAWDLPIVADAAFARYVREAVDFAGGRRLDA
jgi:hypothetical protein